jgi:hypothetical protein
VSSVIWMLFGAAHAVENVRTMHFVAFTKSVHVRKVMSVRPHVSAPKLNLFRLLSTDCVN